MSKEYTWRPSADIEVIKLRAKLYADIRQFMQARNILEVDTPILSRYGISDTFIEQVRANSFLTDLPTLYLHTSPEYCMKRLIAAGIGDCFQISHVFRDGEQGKQHTLEFMMLEWYRLGFDYLQLMEEVSTLVEHIGVSKPEKITYQAIFELVLDVDPLTVETNILKELAQQCGWIKATDERHELLDYLFTHKVIDHIKNKHSLIVYDYPSCMASLSRINENNPNVCERFELFINGIEIANGFTELNDANEQRQRFLDEFEQRQQQGKHSAPIDQLLLDALESGLPDCAGVALGIDRLLMVMLNKMHINEVNHITLDNN